MKFDNIIFHSDSKNTEQNLRLGLDVKAVRIRSVAYKTPPPTIPLSYTFKIHEFDVIFGFDEPYDNETDVEANGTSLSGFFNDNGALDGLPERVRVFTVPGGQAGPQEWLDDFSAALRLNLNEMQYGDKVVFTNAFDPVTHNFSWHITYTGTPRKNFYVSFEGTQVEFNAFNRLVGWPVQTFDDECVLMLTYHTVQELIYSYRSYMNIPLDYVLLRSNALSHFGSIVDGARKNVLKSIPLLGAVGNTWVINNDTNGYWVERPTATPVNQIDWYITDLYGMTLGDAVFSIDFDIK